jgi:high-affinity Fe2+/Pb2+ permease
MIENITLALQIVVLMMIMVSNWHLRRANKATQQAMQMLQQYRREIGWLTERMEMLEHQVPGAIKFK